MSRRDWFRNTQWSAEIEAEFDRRLARARRTGRPQYLVLQAGYLAATHPAAALQLLERYFAEADDLYVTVAFQTRGHAFSALSQLDDAVAAYRAALAREQLLPHVKTDAHLDLAKLVAVHRLRDHYSFVLEALDQREAESIFPRQRYGLHGARALIFDDLGQLAKARAEATLAETAATERHSGLSRHPTVGLVENMADAFGERLAAIVGTRH